MNTNESGCEGEILPPRRSIRVHRRSSAVPFPAFVRSCAVALAVAACAGCISRSILIESEPPGAQVRLNGTPVGETPVTVSFRHYGTYDVELRKDGFETLRTWESVPAPGYARFPLCLFTELLWPGRIRDDRYLSYKLARPVAPDRAGLLRRAADMSGSAGAAPTGAAEAQEAEKQ
jgi:hypothetical protein